MAANAENQDNSTTTDGRSSWFTTTHWSQFEAVKGNDNPKRQQALNYLAERYRGPVYCFVRAQVPEDEAKDLVQKFFMNAFSTDWFAKADPARGRFRSFLLGTVKNFLKNEWRNIHAQKRGPKNGFVSIDELSTELGPVIVLKDTKTPDEIFHRSWLCDLVMRVWRNFEKEYSSKEHQAHVDLLRRRIIAPNLEGAEAPSLRALAREHNLSEKEAGARLVTARRGFQRLLREEIRGFASSEEEVAAEIQDLWRFMSE